MFVRSLTVSHEFASVETPTEPYHGGSLSWNNSMKTVWVTNGEQNSAFNPQRVNIQLSEQVRGVLAWAQLKMLEDQKLDELCLKYPGLKDSKETFDIMRRLCENHST